MTRGVNRSRSGSVPEKVCDIAGLVLKVKLRIGRNINSSKIPRRGPGAMDAPGAIVYVCKWDYFLLRGCGRMV
jgi:hypothetical protein